ncbi:MAG: hypothetical protein WC897_03045 [Candidatus Gracilibacteria bacterium]
MLSKSQVKVYEQIKKCKWVAVDALNEANGDRYVQLFCEMQSQLEKILRLIDIHGHQFNADTFLLSAMLCEDMKNFQERFNETEDYPKITAWFSHWKAVEMAMESFCQQLRTSKNP